MVLLFSLAQSKMLSATTAGSGELLKRKPTADELAAVAVSGASQLRGSPPSPRESSSLQTTPSASARDSMELG